MHMIFFKINDVCLFLFGRHSVVQYISSFIFEDSNIYLYIYLKCKKTLMYWGGSKCVILYMYTYIFEICW